jgi:hypothetical protein
MALDDALPGSTRRLALSSYPPPRVEAEPLREALRSVARALRAVPDRGMIIGDLAVIARGVERPASSVEATLATTREMSRLFAELEPFSLVPRVEDAVAAARAEQVLALRHVGTGIFVDLSLAWRPFELDALAAAEDLMLGTVEVTVARAEDLVIYRALTFRADDRRDIERLAVLHGRTMDLGRVRRTVAELATSEGEGERAGELERALERGLGLAP